MGLVKKRHVEKIENVFCKTDEDFEVISYVSNTITFYCGARNSVCILTALDYPSTKVSRSEIKSCLVINMLDEDFLYFYDKFVDDDKAEKYVKILNRDDDIGADAWDDRYVITFKLCSLKLSFIIEKIESVFYLDDDISCKFDFKTKDNKFYLSIYEENDFINFCKEYFGEEYFVGIEED